MTGTFSDFFLYAGALFILFITPGPVWVAVLARALSGGFHSAWPLALGVAVGDVLWPLIAIVGVTWLVSEFSGFMLVLKWVAAAMFLMMGIMVLRNAGKEISTDSRLTRPGMWAGFAAGVAVILANPKAVLFYMGVLPGFFDLTKISIPDIAIILVLSIAVPLLGNLMLALLVDRMRRLLTSPKSLRNINIFSGSLLILVGLIIPFT